MKRFLPVWFPWIFLFLVTALIVSDQVRSRSTHVIKSPDHIHASTTEAAEERVARDHVCGMDVATNLSHKIIYQETPYYFCNPHCRDMFLKNPEKYLESKAGADGHTMRGIPTWMFQLSVGLIILLSFTLFEWLSWREEKYKSKSSPMARRWNLFTLPGIRKLFKSPLFRFGAQLVTSFMFILIIMAGLFGNQNPAMNIAPLLTWTIWWVGLVFIILFFGKAWCTICPWDAIASWSERLKFWGPRTSGLGLQMKWPKIARNIWPAVLFFILLTWVELGMGITVIPRATAWVALGMLGLTVASAFIFDRKSFCRYGCLVGRISGLYSLFSSVELRSDDPKKCASCKTMDCYRGNDKGDGCPTFEFPKTMKKSTYCTLCTECIKTCPQDNISIRFRPWGSDLSNESKPRTDEAFLALVLLSMTGFHGLTMTPLWPIWNDQLESTFGIPYVVTFSLLMSLILVVPILIYLGLSKITAALSKKQSTKNIFLHFAYALLPIALFYHLAHNMEHFLMEGPKILALLSDPMGLGWNIFGTAKKIFPPLISLEGLWIIQILLVVVGHIYSLWVSEKTTRRLIPERKIAFVSQLPMVTAMIIFSVFSLWLLNLPMEMRVSAM